MQRIATFVSGQSAQFLPPRAQLPTQGLRTLKHAVSLVDARIQGYEGKFKEIKEAFQLRGVLHTGITVVRIMDYVKSTGKISD